MKNLRTLLFDKFHKATLIAYPELQSQSSIPTEITLSTNEKFGHYQCNSAMKLSKSLKLNPRQIAEKIISSLDKQDNCISNLEVAGPGFINITLNPSYLEKDVNVLVHDPYLGIDPPPTRKKVIVDFSSPNTAKEMHVGHLRSTIIGDCIARLFEFLGYQVLRLNHVGDWGTAFGMLIVYIKEIAPKVISGEQTVDLTQLMHWYKASKKKFDEDIDFKKNSQIQVVALQKGDPEALKIWKMICDISRRAYQEIYNLLEVEITERGESFYNYMLPEIVADLEKKGLIEISDGAKCIFLEGFQNREGEQLPLMVQKSDGGYNYDTTDMAAIYHRIIEEKADRIIIVTDAGQSTHFQMIFKTAEKAGYLNPQKVRVDHVGFGLVLGPDGKKFRTRSGETEKLIDLLEAAINHANQILLERNPEMNSEERKRLAHALGIGAVKYADLACNRTGDYMFSYERMLRFEGNTAAFLMYSYVRIEGIKRKVQISIKEIVSKENIQLEHPSEIALGLHLLQFSEILHQVAEDLLPNRLTEYLYVLAEKFNAFFRDCRVEGSQQQNSRLLLCEATARVLKQGLQILGVPLVDKM